MVGLRSLALYLDRRGQAARRAVARLAIDDARGGRAAATTSNTATSMWIGATENTELVRNRHNPSAGHAT